VRWLLVVLVACGGAQTPKDAPAPSCAKVADGMVAEMLATKQQPPPQETADMIKDIIRTSCDRDAWSDPARRCLATMKTEDDADRCAALLTDEQQAALVREEKARLPAH